MRRIHFPVLLANVPDARARAFVVLFTCDAIARSILISVLPLQAYAILGAAQLVSVVYFAVAFVGLATNLTVPFILQRLRRRWVLSAGAVTQLTSVYLLALGMPGDKHGARRLSVHTVAIELAAITIKATIAHHMSHTRLMRIEARQQASSRGAAASHIVELREA